MQIDIQRDNLISKLEQRIKDIENARLNIYLKELKEEVEKLLKKKQLPFFWKKKYKTKADALEVAKQYIRINTLLYGFQYYHLNILLDIVKNTNCNTYKLTSKDTKYVF